MVILSCFLLIFLGSCFGMSMDITMYAEGSGKIVLEYRVSKALEALGRLDGNQKWPSIPVGKADFERSISRMTDLKLLSLTEKNDLSDLVTSVELEFNNPQALITFLNGSGSSASLSAENGLNRLLLALWEAPAEPVNADLLSLLQEISAGYRFSFSFTAPKAASLRTSVNIDETVTNGKKVSFQADTGSILTHNNSLILEISW